MGEALGRVVLVIGNCRTVIQLLCNLRDVVGVVGSILCRHMVLNRAVTASNRNIDWKSEDVLAGSGGIFDSSRISELAVSGVAKTALVAVLVGLQLTMIAIEVILIPCLGCNHTVCRSLILQVCRIAERSNADARSLQRFTSRFANVYLSPSAVI